MKTIPGREDYHMSGHSKWHNIQKTKGAQDAKRAAAFTKIAKEMTEQAKKFDMIL